MYQPEELDINGSFDWFNHTLSLLEENKLNLPDEELEWIFFENLDTDAFSFLHKNTINFLLEEDLIPESTESLIENLRSLIIELMEKKKSIREYRTSSEWKKAREKAKEVRELVELHNKK